MNRRHKTLQMQVWPKGRFWAKVQAFVRPVFAAAFETHRQATLGPNPRTQLFLPMCTFHPLRVIFHLSLGM